MSKKLNSSVKLGLVGTPFDYDHTDLEKFLEEDEEVEAYSRDGYVNYFVVLKSNFNMGTSPQANVGEHIFRKFNYSVAVFGGPFGHSGYLWRTVLYLRGGYKDNIKMFYVGKPEMVNVPQKQDIGIYEPEYTNCSYCKKEKPCLNQSHEKDSRFPVCDKCFTEIHVKVDPLYIALEEKLKKNENKNG